MVVDVYADRCPTCKARGRDASPVMAFGPLRYGFGFVAGTLSVLSPCVLPLLPIVAGTAASARPCGVAALGVLLIALGAVELAGLERSLEALPVNVSPAWRTTLTTRY